MANKSEIVAGTTAPGFEALASDGRTVTLEGLRGRTVVLYFYPKDDTPGCTSEACDFTDNMGRLAIDGVTVLGASRDSIESHGRFIEKYGIRIPLLSDPEGRMHEDYGVLVERTVEGKVEKGVDRSTFLIDGEGVIQKVWRNVKVKGHVDEVIASLASIS